MRIVRSPELTGFAQIPNAALRDERLSYKARGIHANLLSNSDDGWNETAESLADKSSVDGRDAVRSGLRELAKYGYIEYQKTQRPDGKWSTEMIVHTAPKPENPSSVPPAGTPAKPQVGPKTENPASDRSRVTRSRPHQQKRESSQVAPETGYPNAGFPGPIQKTITEDQAEDHKTAPPVAPPHRSDRGTRLPDDFAVTDEMRTWAREHTPLCGTTDHDAFCDYWHSAPGAKGRKVDWVKTWRNWMRREHERRSRTSRPAPNGHHPGALVPTNGRPLIGTDAKVAGWLAAAERLEAQENQR